MRHLILMIIYFIVIVIGKKEHINNPSCDKQRYCKYIICVCVFYFRYRPLNLAQYLMLFLKLDFARNILNKNKSELCFFLLNFTQINHHKQKVYRSNEIVKDVSMKMKSHLFEFSNNLIMWNLYERYAKEENKLFT